MLQAGREASLAHFAAPSWYEKPATTGTFSMALEMREACERCAAPLAKDAEDARICSYECTFCAPCTESMNGRCPNCGGELKQRPRRQK
jgi:uncharacterized protein